MDVHFSVLNPLTKNLGTESAFTVLARAAALSAQGRDIINLGIGQPDFATPEPIVEAAVKALRDGHHGYTPAKGLFALREAVAQDFQARNGVPLDPERILIVPGGKVTMAFALWLLGGAGHEILTPDPGFPIYASMAGFSGATPLSYPLSAAKGYGLDAEAVLAKVTERTRLLILNSPGNPTGGVNDPAELRKLAQGLVDWPHVHVLSDEIYSRLYLDGQTHRSLITFPELAERTIVLDGWSKTYAMTGWRLGWSYWPKSLIDLAERLAINVHSCVNAPTQWAGIAALKGSQAAPEAMRSAFARRRDLVMDRLAAIPRLSAPRPQGAFYAFVDVALEGGGEGGSAEHIQNALLEEAGVATIAGTSFGAVGARSLRLSFAAADRDLSRGLDRIAAWLEAPGRRA